MRVNGTSTEKSGRKRGRQDLNVARKVYEGTLGLKQVSAEGDELIVYRSGNTTFNRYRSEAAGSNKATALTWAVGSQIERVMSDLTARGVKFEHYDLTGMKRVGDLHVANDRMKVAWFKDPDGNILSLASA